MDDSDSTGAGAIFGFLVCLFMLAIFIGLIYWIYSDAKQHQVSILNNKAYDSDSPKIWAFICFLCIIIGGPYYFYRRAAVTALKNAVNSNSSATPLKENGDEEADASQTTSALESLLKEAADLKMKGLITESELEQKRRKILGL